MKHSNHHNNTRTIWNTPTHPGALTPAELSRRALEVVQALTITTATIAALTAAALIF